MKKLKRIIRVCAVIFGIALIILGTISFKEYGNGLGFHLTIFMPLISIAAGVASKLAGKYWWIALGVFHSVCLICVCLPVMGDIYGFIPWAIGYLAISELVGYGFS